MQPQPKIGNWRDELDRLLAESARKPTRDRLTRTRVVEGLGYEDGYDAATWERSEREPLAAAYAPLRFDPGEAVQFDGSYEIVLIDGATIAAEGGGATRQCSSGCCWNWPANRHADDLCDASQGPPHDLKPRGLKKGARAGLADGQTAA